METLLARPVSGGGGGKWKEEEEEREEASNKLARTRVHAHQHTVGSCIHIAHRWSHAVFHVSNSKMMGIKHERRHRESCELCCCFWTKGNNSLEFKTYLNNPITHVCVCTNADIVSSQEKQMCPNTLDTRAEVFTETFLGKNSAERLFILKLMAALSSERRSCTATDN